jgi:hypothetical protein
VAIVCTQTLKLKLEVWIVVRKVKPIYHSFSFAAAIECNSLASLGINYFGAFHLDFHIDFNLLLYLFYLFNPGTLSIISFRGLDRARILIASVFRCIDNGYYDANSSYNNADYCYDDCNYGN